MVRIIEDGSEASDPGRRSFFHRVLAHGAAVPAACALGSDYTLEVAMQSLSALQRPDRGG
jgi:hypothetical protein